MSTSKLLWIVVIGVACNRLCSLVPDTIRFDPFPFYDIIYDGKNVGIDLQSFIYMIANHVALGCIWFFCIFEVPKARTVFIWFLVLEVFALADFLLIYEHPIFDMLWGIEYTDIKLILYASILILWKHGKL